MEFSKVTNVPAKGIEMFVANTNGGILVSIAGDSDLAERSVRRAKLRVDSGLVFIPGSTTDISWNWEQIEHPHSRVSLYACQFPSGKLMVQVGKGDVVMRGWVARGLYTDVSLCFLPN